MLANLSKRARTLILAGLALMVVVGTVNAWKTEPHVWLTYQVQSPGKAPVRVERCGDDDPREYFYRVGPDGRYFNIDLCFKAVEKNSLKFIPYSTDEDGTSWIEVKNSPQVRAYTRTAARSFVFPQADQSAAHALWHRKRCATRYCRDLARAVVLAVRLDRSPIYRSHIKTTPRRSYLAAALSLQSWREGSSSHRLSMM
jgi:hypothetical protein